MRTLKQFLCAHERSVLKARRNRLYVECFDCGLNVPPATQPKGISPADAALIRHRDVYSLSPAEAKEMAEFSEMVKP